VELATSAIFVEFWLNLGRLLCAVCKPELNTAMGGLLTIVLLQSD